MFRASSAHLHEDIVVYMQHMVPSFSISYLWVLTQAVYRQATTNSLTKWQYHMLHVYNCILLKMSTWGSKHVEENNILWINNNQCIKLVINIRSIHDARSEKHQVIRLQLRHRSFFNDALVTVDKVVWQWNGSWIVCRTVCGRWQVWYNFRKGLCKWG